MVRYRRALCTKRLTGPAGAVLDEPGDGERGEHDGQVGVDGFAFAVVRAPDIAA